MARDRELNDIEKKYEATVARISPQIDECLRMAAIALAEAERLAEAHGVPFRSNVSRLGQTYTPTLPKDIDREVISSMTTWVPSDGDGWEHSAVC